MTQATDPGGMEGPTLSPLGLLEQTRRLIESGSVTEPETLAAIDGLASTIRDANRSRPINLPSVTWEDVRDPPPRDWIIPGWLPAGQLTLLTGEGGKGKSRLALQLAAGVAANRANPDVWITGPAPELGDVPAGGSPVLLCSWEDDTHEFGRRLGQISGNHAPWCTPNGMGNLTFMYAWDVPEPHAGAPLYAPPDNFALPKPTELASAIRDRAQRLEARLLVLDSAAAVYAANENDRNQVRQFVGDWNAWAQRTGCAVLLIAHPNRRGDYSGSSDWNSGPRHRLALTQTPLREPNRNGGTQAQGWRFAVEKSNYGAEPPALCLEWDDTGPRWAVRSTWETAAREEQAGATDVPAEVPAGYQNRRMPNVGS